jgi:pyruvate/2-oxoacid:ferredoxin oxidoreductase alpha subunit
VAHVAYRTNDCAYIFPITPSSVSIMQRYAGELQDTIQVLLRIFIFLFSL